MTLKMLRAKCGHCYALGDTTNICLFKNHSSFSKRQSLKKLKKIILASQRGIKFRVMLRSILCVLHSLSI
jgi:hypothetical protein